MNFQQAAPDTVNALRALDAQVQGCGLEQSLIELVKIRASQINGCAYCINMHSQHASTARPNSGSIY
jgi:AhpD family alkylhydroperoxidase